MAKLLKIIGLIVGISFEWLLIFVLLFTFAIRTSPVQTYLANIATNYLSKELNTEIKVDKISIVFINKIALDGVLIKDLKNDTLAYLSTAYVTLDELNLKSKLIIKKVDIENSTIKLSQSKETRDFNYQFIVDYFAIQENKNQKPLVVELNELSQSSINPLSIGPRPKARPALFIKISIEFLISLESESTALFTSSKFRISKHKGITLI